MIQTLVTIASLVVLCGAILTSALASARTALHRTIVAKTQTAMTDATSEFTFWAQRVVATYGTEANWDARPMPAISRPLCASGATCAYIATMMWKITRATAGVKASTALGQSVSAANHLAQAVDEQRISATIDVRVSDATGGQVLGGRTELVTARVFDAAPYVVITGVRDLSSAAGVVRDSEGDSAGTQGAGVLATPNPAVPYAFTDTTIRATLDCENTPNFDQSNPSANADRGFGPGLIDASIRPGGSIAWGYQLPCTPAYGVPAAPATIDDYTPPVGSVYAIDASGASVDWQKGDQSTSSFPR